MQRRDLRGVLGEPKQPELADLLAHLANAVPAENAISEFEEPELAALAVVDVKFAGVIVARGHHEQQHAARELHPVSDHALAKGEEAANDFSDVVLRAEVQILGRNHRAGDDGLRIHG